MKPNLQTDAPGSNMDYKKILPQGRPLFKPHYIAPTLRRENDN